MAVSDSGESDLEVIAVLGVRSFEDEELPDTIEVEQSSVGKKQSDVRAVKEDIGIISDSECTDIILGDSDDSLSLPSIPSPTSMSTSSSREEQGSTNERRKRHSFEDPVAQEIEDQFNEQDWGYSLTDFLANREAKATIKPKPKKINTKLKLPTRKEKEDLELVACENHSEEPSAGRIFRLEPVSNPEKEQEPVSYRIDPKDYRKTKGKSKGTSKSKSKSGTGSSQSSTSTSGANSQMSSGSAGEGIGSGNAHSSMASSSTSYAVAGSSKDAVAKQKQGDLKNVVVKIHEEFCPDEVASKLLEKEVRFELVERTCVPGLLLFERHMAYKAYDRLGQSTDKELVEPDENAMIIFPLEKNLELIQNEVEAINNDSQFSSSTDSDTQSLTEWIKDVKRKLPDKKITLLIHGHEAYIRKIQKSKQKEYRDRIAGQDDNQAGKKKRAGRSKQTIQLSKTEIQSALIHVQLHARINYRLYEKPAELAELLFHFSKSILEAPAKLAKLNSTGFDWYAVSDSVGGVPVDEDGKGMKSLWIQQLCQFPGVGQESAIAIARVYKNPRTLYKAYKRCESTEEGRNLLADVQVTMGVGPLAKTRRLGPEASKRIYRFFTSTDGEREINH